MRRIDADRFYLFEPAYWERLERAAARALRRGDRRRGRRLGALPGEPALAALPPERHDRRRPLDRRLDARPARGRALGPGAAATSASTSAAAWAARPDSLHHFKARFDPDGLVPAAVGKAIHDEDAYRELSGGEFDGYEGFFPAYRHRVE